MPKRPTGIYFVAAWIFLLSSGLLKEMVQTMKQAEASGRSSRVLTLLVSGVFVFLIVFLVGLIQLQELHRKVAIGIFTIHIATGTVLKVPMAMKMPYSYLVLSMMIASICISVLCIWYLNRTEFIEQCRKYREAALYAPKR